MLLELSLVNGTPWAISQSMAALPCSTTKRVGGLIAKTGTGNFGVLNMRIQRILTGQYGCDAALSPAARTIQQGFLGDESNFLMVGQFKSQCQSG